MEKAQIKTNLDIEKIKKSITFRRKEISKEELRAEAFDEAAVNQNASQINYMNKVNGSVIIRLG